ncbi:hypothetical protein JCM11641_007424 [Rhodosporidiobolus odoratus]
MGTRKLPRTLIIDFYDSYTRNLLALIAQHLFLLGSSENSQDDPCTALWDPRDWEQRVVVANVDSLNWDSFITDILPHLDCVVLGPGPGTPHDPGDFSWPHRLLEELGDRLPIFGVCLGCQGLATVFGGKVVRAAKPKHGQISQIHLVSGTSDGFSTLDAACVPAGLFSGIPSPFPAVQYNSLVVDPVSLPNELETLAWAQGYDGSEDIMALRHRKKPLWGVQFHPESIESSYGARLLSNFFSLSTDFRSSFSPSLPSPEPSPVPPHILALSTSFRPSLSSVSLVYPKKRWEQRTTPLKAAAGWTAQKVFEALVKGRSQLGEVWLDSARVRQSSLPTIPHPLTWNILILFACPPARLPACPAQPSAEPRKSHAFAPQATWSYSVQHDTLVIRSTCSPSPAVTTQTIPLSSPWYTDIFDLLSTSQAYFSQHTSISASAPSVPLGFVGHLGYELRHVTLPPQRSAQPHHADRHTFDTHQPSSNVELAFASTLLSYCHETETWSASGLVRLPSFSPLSGTPESDLASPLASLGLSEEAWAVWLANVQASLSSPPPATPPSPVPATLPSRLECRQSRDSYLASIARAQSLIRSGESYELCLSTAFSSVLPASSPLLRDPYPLYLSLRAYNPAPNCAYFRLPLSGSPSQVAAGGLALLSSSPERFLRISSQGQACMKPIKGTVRRSADPVEDRRRKEALQADEKERAENLMIVDLIRNDLMAACRPESVKVEGLMKVESYETVHQLVTTVVGSLAESASPVDLLKASFPPGSMTGAPKMRSVQLLDELEDHEERGAYSGVFGYLAIDGSSDWSVVIRTLVKRGSELSLGAGGAITHLSEPEKEWEEVLTKVEAVTGGLLEKA